MCLAIGGVVSGEVPSTAEPPYASPELFSLGGSPNFTALAAEGLVTCDAEKLLSNSVIDATGDPAARMYTSFIENCPGIMEEFGKPESNLNYECSDACIDWLTTYGACRATDLREVRLCHSCITSDQILEDAPLHTIAERAVFHVCEVNRSTNVCMRHS
jgi:hypothetical protein